MAGSKVTRIKTCRQCGKEYEWRSGERAGCHGKCSVKCHKAWQAARSKERYAKGYYPPSRPFPKKHSDPTPCLRCGGPTTRPKYCSDECVTAWDIRYTSPDKQDCAECGAEFQPTKRGMSYCSRPCQRKAMWRIAGRIYRARKRGAAVERVDPLKVFERDGWKCHLCGTATNKAKRGTQHPSAPEMDHIVPLAQGGAHSYANTACAHRKCNLAKSDKIMGQPSLLVA